jgi:hypothetical protein
MKGRLEGLGYDLLRCTVLCDLVYNSIKNELELKVLERPTHILVKGGSISQIKEFSQWRN